MSTNDDERDNPRDEVLVDALGEGLSYARAAEVVGCSKATVTRRMAEPAFRARVVEAREVGAEEASSLLEGLALRAAVKLSELVDSDQDLTAFKAAALVLERAEQRRQARAFGDRLGQLERLVEQVLDGHRRGLRGVA